MEVRGTRNGSELWPQEQVRRNDWSTEQMSFEYRAALFEAD